jgi:uncharacterized protein with PQ loop repeat
VVPRPEYLGYLAAAIGVVMVLPQIARILRHPTLPGVSPLTWSLNTVACAAWLGYGIRTWQVPQIPGNVLFITGAVAIVLLIPSTHARRTRAAGLAAVAAVEALAVAVLPAHTVGYVAFAVTMAASWPQVHDSFRSWRLHRPSGVSIPAWGFGLLSQVLWLLYAMGVHDTPITVSAASLCVSMVLLLTLESLARSTAGRAAPPATVTEAVALPCRH